MKDWKIICKKIIYPPLWLLTILTLISAVATIWIFVKKLETSPVAYVVYVISFYCLTVMCIIGSRTIPAYYKKVKSKMYENEYANRYFTDTAFKIHVNLYRSLIVNLLFVAFNATLAIIYSTYWFVIFALYYAIMAIMRFLLLRYIGNNKIGSNRVGELKRARLCAYILMSVNLALSGAVLMMVYFGRGFEYYGVIIYVVALYTFYITTTAIVNIIRYRKYNSPVISASNTVKLAASLVSMLQLETAMFSQFGADTSARMQEIMIMATGAGISVVVVTMSVYTIVRSTREIRKIKEQISHE